MPETPDSPGPGAAAAPDWFTRALAAPVELGETVVAGATVRYRAWGPAGAAGTVLVHGGAAHARWWDHIGPQLAAGRRVVAVDLTGHGDSDHRADYALEQWADEAVAVAGPAGITGPPMLIGHSMGGMVAFLAAHRHGTRLAGVQIIDSPVWARTDAETAARATASIGAGRVYPDAATARARFRLTPAQERTLPYVLAHVAETSMRPVAGGWTWKFDPLLVRRASSDLLGAGAPECRLAYLRCADGIVGDDALTELRTRLGPAALVTELPEAGHHPMLDRPLALVAALRTVTAAWGAA